jgi:hypothetical protein
VHDLEADDWGAARDRCADAQPPIGVLIETHDLPGESHPERAEQQHYACEPGQFARILVGAEQEHLGHVDRH